MSNRTVKAYVRPMPLTWWTKRTPYLIFMLRELSSVFIAVYAVWFLFLLRRLSEGPEAFTAYVEQLRSPGCILFHIAALGFAILHTVTWFQATPRAMVIRRGEDRLPDSAIILPNYVAWIVISAVVAWVLVRG